ncbi:metalloregulator ArsR/SmtB family transcription factor [Ferrimonas senticii]|uniref:metalloregulator ArsR/SmtB family transcription factor n=1 Tax=Ferrimonas senticii TaxID=394566 RepID=UPI0004291FF6|nr:metalloregulator ArsR/SmtB family transcription factor [Ferrimonas senticii]
MTTFDLAQYQARTQVLKALAHPTRLWLVEQLEQQERCVCELVCGVDADISTVSKHLSVLKNAGIVSCRRQGKQIFYRLETPCLLKLMNCVETVISSNAKAAVLVANKEYPMKVEVLGPGCKRCTELATNIARIAATMANPIEVEKVSDMAKLLEYNVLSTPGIAIDGKLVSSGRVPSDDEIEAMLR